MGLHVKFWVFILVLVFLFFVLRALKNNVMRPSNSVLWIAISVFLLSIPIFEQFYKWLAVHVFGLADARHIIYIALIGFLLVYVFYLTRLVSRLTDQMQRLLGMVAILENDIEILKSSEKED